MTIKVNLADAIEKTHVTQRIGRSMRYTVCEGHYYVGGILYDFSDTLIGRWTPKRATQFLRREHGDDSITIAHTSIYKQYCDMDLLDFWLNARATSDPVFMSEHFINE